MIQPAVEGNSQIHGAPALNDEPRSLDPPRKVARVHTRGTDQASRKELRDIEDANCNAGMRTLAGVLKRWAPLVDVMKPVRWALLRAIADEPELQRLPLAIGKDPKRQPPSDGAIIRARALVAKAFPQQTPKQNTQMESGDMKQSGQFRNSVSSPTRY